MSQQDQEFQNWYNKGYAFSNSGKNTEAIECYDAAIRLKPGLASIYFNKGNALNHLGKKSEAIECYDEAIRRKSDFAEAYLNKGVVLYDLGRKSEVIDCFDAAIRLKPDLALAYNNKGLALSNLGKKIEAIECYDAAIRLKPDYASPYNNKGNALKDSGRKNESIKCYDAAIRLKPDYASAYLNKGIVLDDLGKKSEAIECYDTAIRIKPDYPEAYNNKGLVLSEIGKKSESIECFDVAIRIKPDYASAYLNKGVAKYDLGRKSEAIDCFDAAIRFKPDLALACNNKGVVLKDLGRKSEAKECYDAAIKLKPNHPLHYCNRAVMLISFEQEVQALQDLNRAYALMQEVQDGSQSDTLSKENENSIKIKLNQDRVQLLSKLTNLQKNAVEFKEDIMHLKSAAVDNAQFQKHIDDKYASLHSEKYQIATKVVDFIAKKQVDEQLLKNILNTYEEIPTYEKKMQEELSKLRIQVQTLSKQKINRDEIDSDVTSHQIALAPTSHKSSDDRIVKPDSKKSGCCEVFAISDIKYRNPLLNKPKLLKQLSEITGVAMYKIIDCSNKLIEMNHNLEEIEIEELCCLMISLI